MWLTAKEIAEKTALHKNSILKKASIELWEKKTKKVKGGETFLYALNSLPSEWQVLFAAPEKTTVSLKSFQEIKNYNRERAEARSFLVAKWKDSGLSKEVFSELYNSGEMKAESYLKKVIPAISPVTLWRYESALKKGGLEALASQYNENKKRPLAGMLTDEQKDFLKDIYFNKKQYTISFCFTQFKMIFGEVVSYGTVKNYINSFSPAFHCLMREGSKKYQDKFVPYIERDYSLMQSMDVWVSDHHMLDAYVIDEKGSVYRPWLTIFYDEKSRLPISWKWSKNPSTYSILEALAPGLKKYGAPSGFRFDNGKDYKSKKLNGKKLISDEQEVKIGGVFNSLNVSVHFTQPYHGQSKNVERFFKTVAENFSKTLPTYAGSNTVSRARDIKETWDKIKDRVKITQLEVEERFNEYVDWYIHNHKHSGDGMNGRTPLEVFSEETKNHVKIDVSDEYIDMLLMECDYRKVQRNGINFNGLYYYSPKLIIYKACRVMIRQDRNDLGILKVYNADDETFICDAVCDALKDLGVTEENMKNAKKQKKLEKELLLQASGIKEKGYRSNEERILEQIPEKQEEKKEAKTKLKKLFA